MADLRFIGEWLKARHGTNPGTVTPKGHYKDGRVAHANIGVVGGFNDDFNNDFNQPKSTYFPVKGDWLPQSIRKEVDGKIGEEFSKREGVFNMRRYR